MSATTAGDPLRASLTLHPAYEVADVPPRLFGSFLEHMGRAVYTGIYEPGHPTADAAGFRGDVADLVREIGTTIVRYPGGNFVSAFDWEDSVGPVAERPTRLDLAWHSVEPNEVGLDEFVPWCRRTGLEPMMALNLGTRGVDAARNLVEYCNHPGGTLWSDRRIANGAPEPHDVRVWCLGNEMDAPWQVEHKDADHYGALAATTAKALRRFDPGLELVACGSSNGRMPTFPDWEYTVLGHCYDDVDYLSMHEYYDPRTDLASFLASSVQTEAFISTLVATCDHVKARLRSRRTMALSFDEWNVWRQSAFHDEDGTREWVTGPPLAEDTYTVADAAVVGSVLVTLLNHCDRVRMAALAQLVNTIAPITTVPGGPAFRQTTFHPFAQAARYARGVVLHPLLTSPPTPTATYDLVPAVTAAATYEPESGALVVFAVNRSPDRPVVLDLRLLDLPEHRLLEHLTLADDDLMACNTAAQPDRVVPRTRPVDSGDAPAAALAPASWNVLRLGRPTR